MHLLHSEIISYNLLFITYNDYKAHSENLKKKPEIGIREKKYFFQKKLKISTESVVYDKYTKYSKESRVVCHHLWRKNKPTLGNAVI